MWWEDKKMKQKSAKRKPFEECTPQERLHYHTPMLGAWDWFPSLRTTTRQEAFKYWGKFGYLPSQVQLCGFQADGGFYGYESRPKLWDENVTTA